MASELTSRIVTVQFEIELPREHAYTNDELIDTLNLRSIQSPYPEIKVVDVKEIGEDENGYEKLLFAQVHENFFPKDVRSKLWCNATFHSVDDNGSCEGEYMVAVYKLPRIAEALQRYKDKTLSKIVTDLYKQLENFQYLHVTKA